MINNLNNIPLLRLLIPFTIGIVSTIYLKPTSKHVLLVFGVTVTSFFLLMLIKKMNQNYKLRWLFGFFIYSNLLLAGAVLTTLKYQHANTNSTLLTEENNQLLIGSIAEATQIKEKTVKAILTIKGVKNQNSWIEGRGKVIVYLHKDSLSKQLEIGDIISFEPKLENVSAPKNPNEFDFRKYLSYHLIHQQAFLRSNNWKLIEKSPKSGIFKFADDCRSFLIKTLEQKGIKGKELAVASALILGYKDNIDAQLKSAYSSARISCFRVTCWGNLFNF